MRFYLGTHKPGWLALTDTPLMVSRRRLVEYKTLPRARGHWIQDSGGFTELALHGHWTITAAQYARETQYHQAAVGPMDFAAPQDWMCEPVMLAKTGLTVRGHQERTINNYGELLSLAPNVPWMPVLQGWALDDYLSHLDMYARAGFDLRQAARVGLGSVCRRQGSGEITTICRTLARENLFLHGFGVKIRGLEMAQTYLTSADSLAWSYDARRTAPLPGHRHKSCANCRDYAQRWYQGIITRPVQLHLF